MISRNQNQVHCKNGKLFDKSMVQTYFFITLIFVRRAEFKAISRVLNGDVKIASGPFEMKHKISHTLTHTLVFITHSVSARVSGITFRAPSKRMLCVLIFPFTASAICTHTLLLCATHVKSESHAFSVGHD